MTQRLARLAINPFSILPRSVWSLLFVCSALLFLTACGAANTMFTVIQAALAGVGLVITGLGSLISPGEASLVTGAVAAIGDLVSAVQAAWNVFVANPTAAGALEAVQAAVASMQTGIPTILQGFKITNPTLSAWVTTLIGLVGKLAAAIAADILPNLEKAATAHAAGDDAPVKELEAKFKALTAKFVADHDAALADSGLPPKVITTVHNHFHRKIGPHVGPIPV